METKTKIYTISLGEYGGGSYDYYTTNKEWFDWIFTSDEKHLPSMVEAYDQKSKSKFDSDELNEIRKTSGSFENDKAICVSSLCKSLPDLKVDLMKWLDDKEFEIIDEYEGLIY